VGQPLKQAVTELCGEKTAVAVIPNVVSDAFACMPQKNAEPFTFVAVGRLVPGKQFDRVVQAFAQAFAGDARMHLTVIGDGPQREPLRQLVQQLGVEAQVTLTGTLTREAVAARMMQAHCLVCYSELETFGVPVIEGWACGLPVIASDALGFSQDWEDARGLVVSHRDVAALEKAMRDVAAGYDRYDPQALSAYAKTAFGEEALYRRLMELYQ
jgi:glycosyltransferase involved in cell wall biosynthesis